MTEDQARLIVDALGKGLREADAQTAFDTIPMPSHVEGAKEEERVTPEGSAAQAAANLDRIIAAGPGAILKLVANITTLIKGASGSLG